MTDIKYQRENSRKICFWPRHFLYLEKKYFARRLFQVTGMQGSPGSISYYQGNFVEYQNCIYTLGKTVFLCWGNFFKRTRLNILYNRWATSYRIKTIINDCKLSTVITLLINICHHWSFSTTFNALATRINSHIKAISR